jgi:predicted DNA-binding antitoxin AbrB/MazE fold protein
MYQELEAVYEHGVLRPLRPLSLEESQQVHITISDPAAKPVKPSWAESAAIDHEFMAYIRAKVAALGTIPTLEEVRRELSVIPGSMVDDFIAERDDR